MNRPYLIILGILMSWNSHALAQKIVYSAPEKKDFDRFRFDVIAHHEDKILVYKAVYFGSPSGSRQYQGPSNQYANPSTTDAGSGPTTSILESAIYIYNPDMKLLETNLLPLPKQISGVHFLVYKDFFYMFYQYQAVHTIYCMAAKIGMDGKMIGAPKEMDHTDVVDINYQSQIYSVIYSEDKKQIIAFNEEISSSKTNILNSLLFDEDLHLVRKSHHYLSIKGSDFLSEFKVDNEGNLVFLGNSESTEPDNPRRAIIFSLPAKKDSLIYHYYVPADLFVDAPRLLIDNIHKKYIVLSFYSQATQGDIEGLFCVIRNAEGDNDIAVTKTILTDSVRRHIKAKGNTKKVFDDFYLQDLHLRKDGGFGVDAENLDFAPDREVYTRWNYLQYLSEQVAAEYVFYDPYEYDHYYPWRLWKDVGLGFTFSSLSSLMLSYNADGIVEWMNVINTPQLDRFHSTIGYKSFVVDDLIYLLYNVTIRRKSYLTAQSVNASGDINTDTRLKEDVEFKDADKDYIYFPRFARIVGAGELILPCRKGNLISLARIEF